MGKRSRDLSRRLRHRIDIQEVIESADSRSAQSEAWETIRSSEEPGLIPAEILELTGRESIAAGAIVAGATVKITIRWRSSPIVPTTMRAIHGSTVFDILAAIPDETLRSEVVLYCARGFKRAG